MTPSRIRIALLSLATLFGILLSVHFFYTVQKGKNIKTEDANVQMYEQERESSHALQNKGDYDAAVKEFEKLLPIAPDKISEGAAKMNIAANLFYRNEGDDRARSIALSKELFSDAELPPAVRANAMTNVAVVMENMDESFFVANFTEEPYASMLPATGTAYARMSAVYLKLLKLSDATHPTSYAEYLIAGDYYGSRILDGYFISTTSRERAAKAIQEYLKSADELAPLDEDLYKPNVILKRYRYRARAIDASARVLNDASAEQVEAAYRLVLEKSLPFEDSENYPAITTLMRVRFDYAGFLLDTAGESRKEDILALLKPYERAIAPTDLAMQTIRNSFASIMGLREGNYAKKHAIAFADLSPEFDAFMQSLESQ